MPEKMRSYPCGDWTMANLQTIARRMGIEVRNSDGSHHVFSFPGIDEDVTVPYKRPIKPVYIRKFLALVDAVKDFMKKIVKVLPPFAFEAYTRVLSRLPDEEGGGFLVTFPDLPGCKSDGETEEEALANGRDAFVSWVSARIDQGKNIPEPAGKTVDYVAADVSGRFLARLPKYIHARLVKRAEREGVSVNALVLAFIASGLGPN